MARILIVTYGSLGDIYPAIALARALNAHGHETTVATSEPHRATITGAGLRFHPVRPNLSVEQEAMVRRIMNGRRGSEYLMRELVYPSVQDMHTDLAAISGEADLLISSELACAVAIVAEQLRRPWVYFALSPISFLPAHDPSHLPGPPALQWIQTLGPAANRFVLRLAKIASYHWWKPVRTLRRQLGLTAGRSPLFEGKYSPHLNLALFSPVLQPAQPDWPRPTEQAGFLFQDEPPSGASAPLPAAVEAFLAAGDAPIIFTLGSAAVYLADDFYAQSAESAQRLGRRALFLIGKNPPPPNLDSSQLAWDYLPHAQVFPRGAVIVHQGGVGTTAQALRADRPMLVMPFAHDQFDNADRVCRLGVARQIARRHYTPKRAAAELSPLLNQTHYHATAQRLGKQLRAETGSANACAAIERLLVSLP